MKIALITIHNVPNYGAILQAFASLRILSKYGSVYTIDYKNPHLTRHMKLFRVEYSAHGMKKLVHDLLNFPYRRRMRKRFLTFIKDQMNLTKPFTADQLMAGGVSNFDCFICGSDQIWNPQIVNHNGEIDPMYFLCFAPEGTLKIAYGSSLGSYKYSIGQKSAVQELIRDFKALGLREKDGCEEIRKLSPNLPIEHVLDPTLLLDEGQWLQALNLRPKPRTRNYLLVYSVPRSSLLRSAIGYFANKFNLEVVAIDKMLKPMKHVDVQIRNAGPFEFIELFVGAKFVITDSFHGTCFSVNFEKPFVCIPAPKGANRQIGLLEALGLKHRIVYDNGDFEKISEYVDYSQAREKLKTLRTSSLEFLDIYLRDSK